MVAIKRYGPKRGAGTTITEKLAEATITPSPLGVVAWLGVMEKGLTDELMEITGKSQYERQCGGRISGAFLPDCAEDFWDASKGAGRQFLIRITDGTDVAASIIVRSREHSATTPGPGRWRNAMQFDAKSGGRWAGANKRIIGEITGAGDLTETTIDTGLTLLEDELAGATLQMAEISGETFNVLGNTTAGIVTVASDALLATKFASGTDFEFTLWKSNVDVLGNDKSADLLFKDGNRDPVNEFGLEVYWNGTRVLNYENLSQDPNSDVYFVNAINDDTGNYEVVATDLFTGTVSQWTRPANQAGAIQPTLTELVLTLEWYQEYFDSSNTGVGTLSAVTVKASTQRDFITLECTSITTPDSEEWSVTSTEQDRTFDDAVTAVPYVGPNDYFLDFTISVGVPQWAVGDKIYIMVETIIPEEAIGGRVFYDTDNTPRDSLEITDATIATVSVRPGNDLTALTAETNSYRLEYSKSLWAGYDGSSGVVDNDYIQALDLGDSLFNQMRNKQLGLIKYAAPGVASTVVQKEVRSYAAANNGPFRQELPANIVTETAAVGWQEDTMGLNDFNQLLFPSWYYKNDPDRSGLKLVPTTGAVQGVEAMFAYSWNGYHKAAAGTKAVLEKCVKLPTGKVVINDEITNPKGIQVIVKKEGNWVIWGDRCAATATGLKFKHKREQLSHYERVLFENHDWIMFAINDPEEQDSALSFLKAFFLPEWKPKRALRGKTFDEAARIKLDNEINTDATRSTGDMNAEIKLRLADTIERFNIVMSPAGIFESLA